MVDSMFAFGDGIGHWALGMRHAFGAIIGVMVYWLLVIGDKTLALHHAGLKSRLRKYASPSDAPKSSILNPQSSILFLQRRKSV